MRKTKQSVYHKIAMDIASRIARNDLEEGIKLSGRSVLSSEYGVSPETVRRALNLLHDEGVVEIKNNTGAIVKNKERAFEYLKGMDSVHDATELKHRLSVLRDKRKEIDHEIDRVLDQLLDLRGRFANTDPLKRFEYEITPASHLVGKTIKDSQFYQNTNMTIVALNKGGSMILTPGPDARFDVGDVLVAMGDIEDFHSLERWMKG